MAAWRDGAAVAVAALSLVCLFLLRILASADVPRLFALHVGLMSPLAPLGAAAVVSVRRRAAPPKERRVVRVIAHAALASAGLACALLGLLAIYAQKQAGGKAHLTSWHAWLGVAALSLWLGAALVAQPHVWREQLRARTFRPFGPKRWLWTDRTHRWVGKAAFGLSLLATASGILGWKAVEAPLGPACCVVLGVAGAVAAVAS
ncbi:hypothetical protein AB1Y20_016901 [Prymnesium parvum]|uniref:Cytochrome b561 domain-containing protein n=1 Tax=Prymnesium parvum TaxID=97485 RepID=A0AB34ICL9_PRYPA